MSGGFTPRVVPVVDELTDKQREQLAYVESLRDLILAGEVEEMFTAVMMTEDRFSLRMAVFERNAMKMLGMLEFVRHEMYDRFIGPRTPHDR